MQTGSSETLMGWKSEAVDMNGGFQMQGGKKWILPKKVNANRFFWDSHWLEIWSNHFGPSMGLNGGSMATDSGKTTYVAPLGPNGGSVTMDSDGGRSKHDFAETDCAAHIGMGGVKIKKEPRQRDEYVYRIS